MTGMNAARHRVTNWTLQPDKLQPMELNHPTLAFPDWNYNGIGPGGSYSKYCLCEAPSTVTVRERAILPFTLGKHILVPSAILPQTP
jgi:hypothetical protein